MIPQCIKNRKLENKVDKLSTYSTEEQVIGTWIDGKPLYRKTFDLGSVENKTSYNTQISIETLVNIYGTGYLADYNQKIPIPFSHTTADAYNIAIVYSNGNINFTIGNKLTKINNTYITLEYTKTTD